MKRDSHDIRREEELILPIMSIIVQYVHVMCIVHLHTDKIFCSTPLPEHVG